MTHSDEYLQMSGIQHFAFCRRQWALAYLEQQWAENLRTAEGRLEHVRCHDEAFREKRGGLLTVRGMRVVSHRLRLTGTCDDPFASCRYARGFLLGKVYNARWVLERATRDHPQRVPVERLKTQFDHLVGTDQIFHSGLNRCF